MGSEVASMCVEVLWRSFGGS